MPDQPSTESELGHKKPKKHESRQEPPKVVVVAEGRTELDYMEAISIVYRGKFVYAPYSRETFDIDMTDKNELLLLLDAHIKSLQGHITAYCYAT